MGILMNILLKKSTYTIEKSTNSITMKLNSILIRSKHNSLSVVIEVMELSLRIINYINSLCSHVECNIKAISKVTFNGNKA